MTRFLSPDSLKIRIGYCEKSLKNVEIGSTYQFLRCGYFCKDQDSTADMPVFNRVVSLKSSFNVKKP